MKCRTRDKADTRHACPKCVEAIQDGSKQTEMFPIFRGVKVTGNKETDNLITSACIVCEENIQVPELQCQCNEGTKQDLEEVQD